MSSNPSISHKEQINIVPTTATPLLTVKNDLIKEQGWEIPVINSYLGRRTQELRDKTGKLIKFNATDYSPRDEIVKSESFADDNEQKFGTTKIGVITKLDIKGRVFAWVVMARKVEVDSSTNVKKDLGGPAFFYRFLDRDGDGKFELLVIDSSEITVPMWVQKKK